MDNDKRLTPEEVGKAVKPAKTAATVRRWITEKGLPATKNKLSRELLISHYALKKWCKNNDVELRKDGE